MGIRQAEPDTHLSFLCKARLQTERRQEAESLLLPKGERRAYRHAGASGVVG